MTVRVVVVDDQQIVRDGLVALLGLLDDISVVGSAGDGSEALAVVASARPDVVLMDLRMPVLDGVEATRRLSRDHPSVAVLVLTTYADDDSIAGALQAGARGYLTKDAGRVEIAAALHAAAAGQSTFDRTVSERLVSALTSRQKSVVRKENPDGLTGREVEVLSLLARGLSNAEIAGELYIGETTVKTHINNAFAKINVRNRSEATRYALEHNL
ncbi:response regulator [Tenggerimyces flavus]|uniref:Response regulator n=1 Tax=Tenggerimyces flavus TaxID=1708749 RepID=A0ABV7YNK7_9ACTN|nr:response regulator transcription factor [Tenggerimyces flavus]MBM7784391.1 DNA-binding NarL/FixJ family response regulator [Tenggerimyces flavus]